MSEVDEAKMEEVLTDAMMDLPDEVSSIETFEEAGVMTHNRGLVVNMADGSEFQITIVRRVR